MGGISEGGGEGRVEMGQILGKGEVLLFGNIERRERKSRAERETTFALRDSTWCACYFRQGEKDEAKLCS